MVERLKKSEEEFNNLIRRIHSQTLSDIENDRKTFKIHREERQKKVSFSLFFFKFQINPLKYIILFDCLF